MLSSILRTLGSSDIKHSNEIIIGILILVIIPKLLMNNDNAPPANRENVTKKKAYLYLCKNPTKPLFLIDTYMLYAITLKNKYQGIISIKEINWRLNLICHKKGPKIVYTKDKK